MIQRAAGLFGYFASHRTAANLLLLLMLVLGGMAMTKIRSQFFPDVVTDSINVTASWDGAGPEDIDSALIGVLEPALLGVDGVAEIISTAREGSARISIEFEPDWDMDRAEKDVTSAIDGVSNLPDGADDVSVNRSNWSDRVTDVVISGPTSLSQLGLFADEFVTLLFRDGITRTRITGFAAPELMVEVSQQDLIRHELTLSEIATLIANEAEADPAGDVGATQRVRTGVDKRSLEQIEAIVLRSGTDGTQLRIKDVAKLTLLGPDAASAYYIGDNPAISIRVDRSQSGDAIRMQAQVEEIAARFEETLPAGTSVQLTRTMAETITQRLDILLENGLTGLVLVLVLLFVFLSARTAIWVAAGIPVSMISTVGIMYASGISLNMISLFALIICLGIVVDDAIVVGEHADFRLRHKKESPTDAAVNAARRMAAPVFSASITTIIAFSGLTLLGGRLGEMVVDIPLTVIAVLIASLVECFLILPAHMRHALKSQQASQPKALNLVLGVVLIPLILAFLTALALGAVQGNGLAMPSIDLVLKIALGLLVVLVGVTAILPKPKRASVISHLLQDWFDLPSKGFNRAFGWFRRVVFKPVMKGVVFARYPVFALAVLALTFMISLFQSGEVQWRFFSPPERSSLSGNVAMLPGAVREDTVEMVSEMQRAVRAVGKSYEEKYGVNPVLFVMGQVGGTTGRGLSGADSKDIDQLGSISIELIDADLRPYSASEVLSAIQEETGQHPMLETLSFRSFRFGAAGDSLDVKFYGAEADTLKAASLALQEALSVYPEVSGMEDTLAYDKSELVLELTPLGEALGFSIEAVGAELRRRLNGIEAATFPIGTRTATVTVALPEDELTADFLSETRLLSPAGQFVPLAEIVSSNVSLGFSQVRRENGLRVVTVTGEISEDDADRAALIQSALQDEILPDVAGRFGVSYVLGGLAEQEREFLSDAMLGLILCLLGIYLTLCWVFASWTRPIVVMAIIPFGLTGAIWGHYIWDIPLSMFSVVGLIGMTGIIINDSIVLITTIDEYTRTRGLRPALIDAVSDRLRPVLLTTLTTVLGLAPLLYESSSQAQFLKPTVITLAYGLGFGVVLVLLITPALVAVQYDTSRTFKALRRAVANPATPPRTAWMLRVGAALGITYLAALFGPTFLSGELLPAFSALSGGMPLPAALIVLGLSGAAVISLVLFTLSVILTAKRKA